MPRSITRIIRSAQLRSDKELASVILTMMMAVNDAGLVANALEEWSQTNDRRKKARFQGGQMYFSRISMAHCFEVFTIVDEINASAKLREAVADCDEQTRESFAKLTAFRQSQDYKLLLLVRNNLSFHYDRKLAVRALDRIVDRNPKDIATFSIGTETLDWYFELADKVVNSIMRRDLMKIEDSDHAEEDVDAILLRFGEVLRTFGDFAAHFTRNFTRGY
jgi:hypothetical protein